MLAVIVYTALSFAGALLLWGKHLMYGATYRDDRGPNPVAAVLLGNLWHGLLIWWVAASVPTGWPVVLMIILGIYAFGVGFANAVLSDGQYTQRVWETVLDTILTTAIIWGLFASVL